MAFKDTAKAASAAALGALLYSVLTWIPIAGAAFTGFMVGYLVGGGFKSGFKAAALTSCAGTVLIALLLSQTVLAGLDGVLLCIGSECGRREVINNLSIFSNLNAAGMMDPTRIISLIR